MISIMFIYLPQREVLHFVESYFSNSPSNQTFLRHGLVPFRDERWVPPICATRRRRGSVDLLRLGTTR